MLHLARPDETLALRHSAAPRNPPICRRRRPPRPRRSDAARPMPTLGQHCRCHRMSQVLTVSAQLTYRQQSLLPVGGLIHRVHDVSKPRLVDSPISSIYTIKRLWAASDGSY
ncbi:hypothetical protein LX36DRAFT_98348 [Colletotrichum falcatum]|nr:hypothetical protein LX36DRAFT_98348 [Colletotrichum falcatum]